MFEVKKGDFIADCKLEYPDTHCMVTRDLTVNWVNHFITGYGKTTCMADDKFNKSFGEELARIRASINYLKQEEKLLISLTKQPEWRKETPEKYLHTDGGQVFEVTKEEHEALHSTSGHWKDLINKYGGRRIPEQQFMTVGEHEKYHKDLLRDEYLSDYEGNKFYPNGKYSKE